MTLKHVHKITIYYLLHHPIQKWGKGEGGERRDFSTPC